MTRVVVGLCAALALAAPAHAGTIRASWEPKPGATFITFTAAMGERNVFTAELVDDHLRLTDAAGAPTGDCPSESPTTAVCGDGYLIIDAGDGDDTILDRSGRLSSASGGPGDDRLETTTGSVLQGGEGDDVLLGGPRSDVLAGGAGRDRLTGGSGDDRFAPGDEGQAPAPDVVSGGPGADTVRYSGRDDGVHVDLRRDRGPEADVLAGIEHAIGGSGDDVLRGDAQRNKLDGADGRDRLEGRGGNDRLTGEGRDRLSGGAGHDRFHVTGTPDVRCGPGRDTVADDDDAAVARVHADCERVELNGATVTLRPRSLRAGWDVQGRRCPLRVTVNGRRVSSRRTVAIRRPATVRIQGVGKGQRCDEYLPPRGAFRLV